MEFSFRRVEKHFELGEAPVVTLLKASDGKLWVGTFNGGLYCIEGNRVRSFKAGEGGQLVSNKIWALQEDRNGNIWIGFWMLVYSVYIRRAIHSKQST